MQTEILRVTGMRSAICADAIAKALDTVDSVDDFSISLAAGSVTIRYDKRRTSPKEFQAALTAAGYPGTGQPAHAAGGCCGSCGGE
jgi:copper chaperone CopZ